MFAASGVMKHIIEHILMVIVERIKVFTIYRSSKNYLSLSANDQQFNEMDDYDDSSVSRNTAPFHAHICTSFSISKYFFCVKIKFFLPFMYISKYRKRHTVIEMMVFSLLVCVCLFLWV